jgi:hypothetical protein
MVEIAISTNVFARFFGALMLEGIETWPKTSLPVFGWGLNLPCRSGIIESFTVAFPASPVLQPTPPVVWPNWIL